MWRTVFIALHAVAGLVALVAGCVALVRRRLLTTYLVSMVLMAVFLAAAVVGDWSEIGTGARVLFLAFVALACFMVWRGWMARRLPAEAPSRRYVAHLGFTLVALFDAFAVIAVLDATGSGWLAAATGVVLAVAGHYVLVAVERRLLGPAVPATGTRRTS